MAKPLALRSTRKKIKKLPFSFSFGSFLKLLAFLAILAVMPPIFLHLRLKRQTQKQTQKCGWLQNPPLVCAHGGDSSRAPANTMAAYRLAIQSDVDCVEIDASRSHDGVLVALHDRDLQNMSGDNSAKVGNLNLNQIKRLDAGFGFSTGFVRQEVPTLDAALKFVSKAVKQVIVDAKVGPPRFEDGLALDLLLVMNKTRCRNCIIWAKTDILGRELKQLSHNVMVGYIVMKDPVTGIQNDLLRMESAEVIGVYHMLVNEKLVGKAHRAGKKVYAWTVDNSYSMQKMLFAGVDSIITSNPRLLQQVMEDIRKQCIDDGFLRS